eukprot:PhM_4_TR16469/c0_g1_i1/m.82905
MFFASLGFSLAVRRAGVVGGQGGALLTHVCVRCLAVELIQVQRVATRQLADVALRVLRLAHVRAVLPDALRIEDIERVVIDVGLLRAVEVKVAEHTTRLPHVAHKDTAHLRLAHSGETVTGCVVDPRVLLDNGVDLGAVHTTLSREAVDGGGLEVARAHALVPRLTEDDAGGRNNLLKVRKHNLNEVPRQTAVAEIRRQARVVVLDGVDPAVDQVAVAIVEAAHCGEEFPRGGGVELGAEIRTERNDDSVVAGEVGQADPFVVFRALHAVDGPVGGVHRGLTEEERAVRVTHRNDGVTGRGAHRPGQHRVEAVETDDTDEVTRLDVFSGKRIDCAVARRHDGLQLGIVLEEVHVVVCVRRGGRDIGMEESDSVADVVEELNRIVLEHKHAQALGLEIPHLVLVEG